MGASRRPYRTVAALEDEIARLDEAIEAAHILQLRARSVDDARETERLLRQLRAAKATLIDWRQWSGAEPD